MKSLNLWFLSVAVCGLFAGLAAWLAPVYYAYEPAAIILTVIPILGLLSLPIIIWTVKLFTVRAANVQEVLAALAAEGKRLANLAVQADTAPGEEAVDGWGRSVWDTMNEYFGEDVAESWQSSVIAGEASRQYRGLASEDRGVLRSQIEAAAEWIDELLRTKTLPGSLAEPDDA